MNIISINYEENNNGKIKRIMLNDGVGLIYENLKMIQFKDKKVCQRIIETLYIPQQRQFEHLYMYLPSIKKEPKKRLEIIDGYDSYIFDVDKCPSFVKEFLKNLEKEMRHGKWESQESIRRLDKMYEDGGFIFKTKLGKRLTNTTKNIFKKFK